MKRNKLVCTALLILLSLWGANAQGYNTNRTALSNFLTRMYNNAPFEGVRIVKDYDKSYIISVLELNNSKYLSESVRDRVAGVKAMAQVSKFINGSRITQDLIINTSESSDGNTKTDVTEEIREYSIGLVKSLELLTSFPKDSNNQVFIYIKEIDKES